MVRARVELDEALVRRHQPSIWRYLRFLGASPALADDLTQEAFLALLRHPPEDRGDAATAGWLRTVARRSFSQSRASRRRGLEFASESAIEQAWLEAEGAAGDPADPYGDALRHCLEGLSPRARRAVDLRYGDNASRDAMALALELTAEGVKTLLRRTRDALQSCIETRLRRER